MKVYLIFGHTGEYDSYYKWLFKKVYINYQSAIDKINELNNKLKQLNMHIDNSQPIYDWSKKHRIHEQIMRILDPSFHYDYTGASYEIEEAERED